MRGGIFRPREDFGHRTSWLTPNSRNLSGSRGAHVKTGNGVQSPMSSEIREMTRQPYSGFFFLLDLSYALLTEIHRFSSLLLYAIGLNKTFNIANA